MELILQGERLRGFFRGVAKYWEGWAGSEYSERRCDYYKYHGTGVIHEGVEKRFFDFETESRESRYDRSENYTFEEALINFGQRDFAFKRYYELSKNKGVIPERYPLLVDLALSGMLEQIKQSDEEIPNVKLVEFRLEDLIEMGLCYQADGQMSLLFEEVRTGK